MKICVSATEKSLEAPLDPRFGRCLYLVIVNSETMEFEAYPNLAADSTGGVGIQIAQTIANEDVKVVITGNIGPNAIGVLSAAGIEIVTGAFGTVREVVEKFKRGELQRTGAPLHPAKNGRRPKPKKIGSISLQPAFFCYLECIASKSFLQSRFCSTPPVKACPYLSLPRTRNLCLLGGHRKIPL